MGAIQAAGWAGSLAGVVNNGSPVLGWLILIGFVIIAVGLVRAHRESNA